MSNELKTNNLKGWYIVFISALTGCVMSAGFPQFSMTINQLSERTSISPEVLLTGDTVKSAAIVVAMLVSGFAYKKLGARVLLVAATMVSAVPQFLMPYTSSVFLFMSLKALQGLSSCVFPVFLILIMDNIEESKTGFATAVFNGIFYGGAGIGSAFAGFVIMKSGWVSSYFALGIVQIIVGAVWLLTVNDTGRHEAEAGNIDNAGQGGVSAIFRSPKIWLLIITFFSTTFVLQAITVDMPIFGAYLGYDDMGVGSAMSAVTAGIISACLVSGKISDICAARSKNKGLARIFVLLIGLIFIIVAVALFFVINLQSFVIFFGAVFLISFGAAWGLGTFYCILPEIYDEETLPVVTGLAGGAADLGMPLAPTVVGVVFGVKGLWTLGWGACAALAGVSIIAGLLLCRLELKAARAKKC